MASALLAGCSAAPALGPGLPPLPNQVASPEPHSTLPYPASPTTATPEPLQAFPYGPDHLLYLADPASRSILAFPGVGPGVANPALIDGDRRIIYDRAGRIRVWDMATEQEILPAGLPQDSPLADPSLDASASFMVCHSQWQAVGWVRRPLTPPSSPGASRPLAGQAIYFTALEGLAADHGGIADLNVDDSGNRLVMLTLDGRVFTYDRRTSLAHVVALLPIPIEAIALSPAGNRLLVAYQGKLLLLSEGTTEFDPLPLVNSLGLPWRRSEPTWITRDEFRYLEGVPGQEQHWRRYEWRKERLRTAWLLNPWPWLLGR